MNRLIIILGKYWQTVCRFHAKLLSRIYAKYKRTSTPVKCGQYTILYESYCSVIQKKCEEYRICIPHLPQSDPCGIVRWYLSLRFGWPWPIRLAMYQGKTLENIATTPDEMAHTTQRVWDYLRAQYATPKEPPRPLPTVSKRSCVVKENEKKLAITTPTKKKRIVNPTYVPIPHPKPECVTTLPKADDNSPIVSLTEVAGAVIDNSF